MLLFILDCYLFFISKCQKQGKICVCPRACHRLAVIVPSLSFCHNIRLKAAAAWYIFFHLSSMQFCSSSECANQMHHFETAYLNEYLITSEIGFPMYAGQIENTSRWIFFWCLENVQVRGTAEGVTSTCAFVSRKL